jgi:hypothetical protein
MLAVVAGLAPLAAPMGGGMRTLHDGYEYEYDDHGGSSLLPPRGKGHPGSGASRAVASGLSVSSRAGAQLQPQQDGTDSSVADLALSPLIIEDSRKCFHDLSDTAPRASEGAALTAYNSHMKSLSEAGYKRFLVDLHGNLSIPTAFGRTVSYGCACRWCPNHQKTMRMPETLSDSINASKCFSAYNDSAVSNLGSKEAARWTSYTVIGDHRESWPSVEGAAYETDDLGQKYPCSVDVMELMGPENDSPRFERVGDEYHYTKMVVDRCLTPNRVTPDLPPRTLFLLGDSGSGSFASALVLAVRGRYQVRPFHIGGIGVVMGEQSQDRWRHERHKREVESAAQVRFIWEETYDHVRRLLKEHMQAGDLLIIMGSCEKVLDTPRNSGYAPEDRDVGYLPMSDGYARRVEKDFLEAIVEPAGARLLLMGPSLEAAWVEFDLEAEAEDILTQPTVIDAMWFSIKYAANWLLQDIVARHPETAFFIDLLEFWCAAPFSVPTFSDPLNNPWSNTSVPPVCSTYIPGTDIVGYRDENHFNVNGVIYMWPHLCSKLESMGLYDTPREEWTRHLNENRPPAPLPEWMTHIARRESPRGFRGRGTRTGS